MTQTREEKLKTKIEKIEHRLSKGIFYDDDSRHTFEIKLNCLQSELKGITETKTN